MQSITDVAVRQLPHEFIPGNIFYFNNEQMPGMEMIIRRRLRQIQSFYFMQAIQIKSG